MALDDLIQLRTGSAAWFTAANPTLAAGEPGYEVDKDRLKWGTGAAAWASLGYAERDSPIAQSLADVVEITSDIVTAIDIVVPATAAYESLHIVLAGHSSGATSAETVYLRFNDDAAANYDYQLLQAHDVTGSASSVRAGDAVIGVLGDQYQSLGGADSPLIIEIPLHRMTGGFRTAMGQSARVYGYTGAATLLYRHFVMWRSTANIIKVSLRVNSNAFAAGTRVICYGIKP